MTLYDRLTPEAKTKLIAGRGNYPLWADEIIKILKRRELWTDLTVEQLCKLHDLGVTESYSILDLGKIFDA